MILIFLSGFRKEGMVSNSKAVVMAVKETLRYGLFLGTFAGTFVCVDECIAALGGHRRHVTILLLFLLWCLVV